MAFRGIPQPPHVPDRQVRLWMERVFEQLQIWAGREGKPEDALVRKGDLRDTGVVNLTETGMMYDPNRVTELPVGSGVVTLTDIIDTAGDLVRDTAGQQVQVQFG